MALFQTGQNKMSSGKQIGDQIQEIAKHIDEGLVGYKYGSLSFNMQARLIFNDLFIEGLIIKPIPKTITDEIYLPGGFHSCKVDITFKQDKTK